MKTKFYIEFENINSQRTYTIQSRYFDTRKQALNWFKKNFDYIDNEEVYVYLMIATFDEEGELDEIDSTYEIINSYRGGKI